MKVEDEKVDKLENLKFNALIKEAVLFNSHCLFEWVTLDQLNWLTI